MVSTKKCLQDYQSDLRRSGQCEQLCRGLLKENGTTLSAFHLISNDLQGADLPYYFTNHCFLWNGSTIIDPTFLQLVPHLSEQQIFRMSKVKQWKFREAILIISETNMTNLADLLSKGPSLYAEATSKESVQFALRVVYGIHERRTQFLKKSS